MEKTPKINIFFPILDTASSGGNNFLRGLRSKFIELGVWAETINKADIILFNSHHELFKTAQIKKDFSHKVFLHRVDGPMKIYNHSNDRRDDLVILGNNFIADGTVFQSNWCKEQSAALGFQTSKKEAVIWNAPDQKLFNFRERKTQEFTGKLKVVSVGWSTNPNKGADAINWCDENLDYNKVSFDFIGKSNSRFKNIQNLGVMDSSSLAKKLQDYDILFFPSIYEACSNSLLEGIHSGLIPIASGSSSNIEIVQNQSLLYKRYEEIPLILEYVSQNYSNLINSIELPNLEVVAKKYYEFGLSLLESKKDSSFNFYGFALRYGVEKLALKVEESLRRRF